MFYLVCGFEEITRNAFGSGEPEAMRKAKDCIKRCHDEGIEPYTSRLAGNDTDDKAVFDRILAGLEKSEFLARAARGARLDEGFGRPLEAVAAGVKKPPSE